MVDVHGEEKYDVPCSRSSSPTRSLVRVRLTDWRDLERVHTHSRVVDLKLAVASVDNVHDSVDWERRQG